MGFPQLCLQDGPLGVRQTELITAFPAGITTGATWDKSLMYARGVAMGEEFRGKGANFYLGPVVGPLGRKPRGGRNWEGFGADPVLQAIAGAQTIRGVQEQGVIATVKHLIGNEQEMYRRYDGVQDGYSSNIGKPKRDGVGERPEEGYLGYGTAGLRTRGIDDRTLHELYLWPFAEAVHAGVGAVMTAYNAVSAASKT